MVVVVSYCSLGSTGLLSLWSPPGSGRALRVPGGQQDRLPRGPGATSELSQDRDVQLSKALSYALRHGALKLGLPMGAGKCGPGRLR